MNTSLAVKDPPSIKSLYDGDLLVIGVRGPISLCVHVSEHGPEGYSLIPPNELKALILDKDKPEMKTCCPVVTKSVEDDTEWAVLFNFTGQLGNKKPYGGQFPDDLKAVYKRN